MKKHILTLILILTALAAVEFLLGPDAIAQASGVDQNALGQRVNSGIADSAAVPTSPIVQIVVGFTGILFGCLTFLPLLLKENSRPDIALAHGNEQNW